MDGACLCGGVTFVVHGPVRDAIVCHCSDCRRWHGASPAMVGAAWRHVAVSGDVVWYEQPTGIRRGFCGTCGSSLFWRDPHRGRVAIPTGALDEPVGIQVIAHIFTGARPEVRDISGRADHYPGPPPSDLSAPPEPG